jgi:8-oxo-dGTP diphosphatase
MPIEYVLGFTFDAAAERVLLVHKLRPDWQAGKLNGIGGKIEPGEAPIEALVREVSEEAAISTSAAQWRYFGVMDGPYFRVYCFETRDDRVTQFQSLTDERVELVPVDLNFILANGQRGLASLVAQALNTEQPFLRLSYGLQGEDEKLIYPAYH